MIKKLTGRLAKEFYYYQFLFQTRKNRKNVPQYKVLNHFETINAIIKNKSSISRLGDGEFRLLFAGHYLEFQQNSEELRRKLQEVLNSDLKNLLVAIPEPFKNSSSLTIPKEVLDVYNKSIITKIL